jgi:hypothetical protein
LLLPDRCFWNDASHFKLQLLLINLLNKGVAGKDVLWNRRYKRSRGQRENRAGSSVFYVTERLELWRWRHYDVSSNGAQAPGGKHNDGLVVALVTGGHPRTSVISWKLTAAVVTEGRGIQASTKLRRRPDGVGSTSNRIWRSFSCTITKATESSVYGEIQLMTLLWLLRCDAVVRCW